MTKTPLSQQVSPLDRHLGRRIASRRRQQKISVAELEKAISAPPGSVSRFEAGNQSLNAALIFTLSRVLDVPVLYFFEGLSALYNSTLVEEPAAVPAAENINEAERFLDVYFKIADAKVRRDILGLMKAAAGDQEEPD